MLGTLPTIEIKSKTERSGNDIYQISTNNINCSLDKFGKSQFVLWPYTAKFIYTSKWWQDP